MSYQVAVLNFEGPLDLLLQLVEKSQFEITTISLGELTEQYLDYLRQLQAITTQDLHQFIELATRLVYIKSLALLPGNKLESDPGIRELREQLATYQRYHLAAGYLTSLLGGGRSYRRQVKKIQLNAESPLPKMELSQLAQVFQSAISKIPKTSLARQDIPVVTLEEMMTRLALFADAAHARLDDFLASLSDRLELIMAFLATLELLKAGKLKVSQEGQFGAIIMSNEKSNA